MTEYRNPIPTVDVVIELLNDAGDVRGIVLIERKNPPPGWALPGGFVDEGERLERAAVREAEEETGLDVELICQLHTYSDPARDPRKHTISTVFVGRARGEPEARDDAANVGVFADGSLPAVLAFDHATILADYRQWRKTGERPAPRLPS